MSQEEVVGRCMVCGLEYRNCKFCIDCGGQINNVSTYKKCKKCGGAFPRDWKYCSNDGEKLN